MLKTQLQENPEESHSYVGKLASNFLILSAVPYTTKKVSEMGGVNHETLLSRIDLR